MIFDVQREKANALSRIWQYFLRGKRRGGWGKISRNAKIA
jgi:hypothetical protein